MEELFIRASDGYSLDRHIFEARGAKAAVQIIRGMEAHQERYKDFAELLREHEFTEVSSDIRGYGRTAKHMVYFKDRKRYF